MTGKADIGPQKHLAERPLNSSIALRFKSPGMSLVGQNAKCSSRVDVFRLTAENGH
jgi:hypothetical protein